MKRYRNLEGASGVLAYESGINFIKVKFVDGSTYTYTFKSAGKAAIAQMKKLAEAGRGLSTYISRYVKEKYAAKEGD
jgi:hypothetical protein